MNIETKVKNTIQKYKLCNKKEKILVAVSGAVSPLFISDPFKKKMSGLTQTHPPIDERIKVLEKM